MSAAPCATAPSRRFVGKWGAARLNSPNDVICAANGDILFTDPTYGLRQPDGTIVGQEYPHPGVCRLSLEKGTLQMIAKDFAAPNGLALTEDGSKMYICDTREQHIRIFDVAADGTLENGRVFCEAKHGEHQGRPDGMKLDSQGNVYLAANSPEGIWVFDPRRHAAGLHRRRREPREPRLGRRRLADHVRHGPDVRLPPAHEGPRPARPLRAQKLEARSQKPEPRSRS